MPDYLNPDQASTKFMPRLSGDAGEISGHHDAPLSN